MQRQPTDNELSASDTSAEAAAHERLLVARARCREMLGEEIEAPGQMTYGSQAAAATRVFEQQRDLALRDRVQAELAEVEAALARIEIGSFGRCTSCGGQIPPGRLAVLPWAAECVTCSAAAQASRTPRRGARR